MIRVLHTTDLHLGAVFPELPEHAATRRADQLETFERIIALALSQKVHVLLVTGDLFASPWPAKDVVACVQAGFKRLQKDGILPVVLPGRSDTLCAARGIYGRDVFEGVLVLDSQGVESVSLDVGGQSLHLHAGLVEAGLVAWPALDKIETDGMHIGLLRLPASTASNRATDRLIEETEWYNRGGGYLALGGLHNYREWIENGRVVGCCPGTPEGLTFAEHGARYCVVCCLEAGQLRIEKHAVNTRFFEEKRLDVSGYRSIWQVLERIRSLGHPDLLMRVSLIGQANQLLNARMLRHQAADAFYYLEIDDRTPLLNTSLLETLVRGKKLPGLVVRNAKIRAASLPAEQRSLLDAALREILERCQPMGGDQ